MMSENSVSFWYRMRIYILKSITFKHRDIPPVQIVKYEMESKLFILESLPSSATSVKLQHEIYSILNDATRGQNNCPNFVKAIGKADTCFR